jgi:PAS domain S-box-containing protein
LINLVFTKIAKNVRVKNPSQEFYQLLKYNVTILQNLPINLIVTDSDERIKIINKYGTMYFSLHNVEIEDLAIEDLFTNKNEQALKLIREALRSKKEKFYYNVPLKQGDIETVNNIIVYPIYDGAVFVGNIIIIEDITEREKLREQLTLAEKIASIGLLAAGVAHEINNPLEIIYNYIKYLKYNITDEELSEVVDGLKEEISYIANIVSSLMAFSESKKNYMEEVCVSELINSILNLVKYNSSARKININFETNNRQLRMTTNANEMKLIILNLLKNSFDAMPDGGDIYIRTDEVINDGTDYVRIVFRDTGCGIVDIERGNIFLPFYSTKKSGAQCTGLGLYVCYSIIKKHNGEISVKNLSPRGGCEFTIKIPQALAH